ncbi:helix-turn-helix domain-containing protein [Kribbella sp. NPDC023855]|uniref:AraC family transcriptional regulator n=1 Tax=Kribbella sp. NPDC023855 TaxID=3154698 RepID=UPI00340D5928
MVLTLRFELEAFGRPFNAARVWYGPDPHDSVRHTHQDFYELMGVLSGSGEHLLTSGSVPLDPGDVVLVRPTDEHAMAGREAEGVEFVNVSFPVCSWQTYAELSHLDPAGRWDLAPRPPVFRAGGERLPELVAIFETALLRTREEPRPLDLLQFWTDLFLLVVPVTDAPEGGKPAWLRAAQRAMRQEDNLRVGLPRMLELANVSAGHLAREMRRHDGTTPVRFITDLRLQHAATLLHTTTYSVAEIAERAGFGSQSYFARCFAATYYLSPREFRMMSRR